MQIQQDMTIYTAAELKPRLLRELADDAPFELDLSAVAEMDSAGLQLLLLARREAAAAARPLRIINPSAAVIEVLSLAGLQSDAWLAGEPVSGASPGAIAAGDGVAA